MNLSPFYRRARPLPQNSQLFAVDRIDLSSAHLPPYPGRSLRGFTGALGVNSVSGMVQRFGLNWPPESPISLRQLLADSRPLANAQFDDRAAAAVSATVGDPMSVRVETALKWITRSYELCDDMGCHTETVDDMYYVLDDGTLDPNAQHYNGSKDLLELKLYDGRVPNSPGAEYYVLKDKSLAVMAYADYFPSVSGGAALRGMVSEAIMKAKPGFCGSFGPAATGAMSLEGSEGNYDMNQMHLLALAYNYYWELTPDARERLITQLLASGRIHRPNRPDTLTSGGAPDDWSRAGLVSPLGVEVDLPETENHVLMIATARYLTNQLLYERDQNPSYDNRRNGVPGDSPNCMDQVLFLLRNELRDDFAEYNAKNYQEHTRNALLDLCSYAYDAEVRLGARMVLDYISAHIAVSSNDLRRMVPFRRRNEGINVLQIAEEPGFMDVSLLDAHGADPMAAQFALLAGNTRAYELESWDSWGDKDRYGKPIPARPWPWAITPNFGAELTLGALSRYRLPPSIHDLFVNDLHRRFFQRIHRYYLEEPGQQRNCDNMEIFAGSPSYLITAGGKPAPWVIPGHHTFGYQDQNLGVAVPISFMPTGRSGGNPGYARELIQLLRFSDSLEYFNKYGVEDISVETENYGVAPDFACGFAYHFPAWTGVDKDTNGYFFVNKKSFDDEPGFFLAIIKWEGFALIEAFDTWLHPEVSYEQFQEHVNKYNPNIRFRSGGEETVYTTYYGNRIHFAVWNYLERSLKSGSPFGSTILEIEYGAGDPNDTLVEAGNYIDRSQFLSGTVLKSPRPPDPDRPDTAPAVVEIHNAFLGTMIKLDWGDPAHLVRTSEDGTIEQAGRNSLGQLYEVWVDFDWSGEHDGDFYHPFNTLVGAVAAVADGGTIKIMPGTTSERSRIHAGKRIRLVAPMGGVTIGGH